MASGVSRVGAVANAALPASRISLRHQSRKAFTFFRPVIWICYDRETGIRRYPAAERIAEFLRQRRCRISSAADSFTPHLVIAEGPALMENLGEELCQAVSWFKPTVAAYF